MLIRSQLLKKGLDSYKTASDKALALLNGIAHTPVQRSNGIDAFLEETYQGVPIPVRVQRHGETVAEAALALYKAAKTKRARRMILIAIEDRPSLLESAIPEAVHVIPSTALSISRFLQNLQAGDESSNQASRLDDNSACSTPPLIPSPARRGNELAPALSRG